MGKFIVMVFILMFSVGCVSTKGKMQVGATYTGDTPTPVYSVAGTAEINF